MSPTRGPCRTEQGRAEQEGSISSTQKDIMQISKSEIRLVWGGEPKVGLRPGAGRRDPPTSSLGHTPRGRCPELNSHHGCRISSPRLWAFASPSPHISAPASWSRPKRDAPGGRPHSSRRLC